LIYPAINPLTRKNRDLSLHELTGIMVNSALTTNPGPVLTPMYATVAERLQPDGRFMPANMTDDLGLMTRPIITQISRWDHLKGFLPLMRAFAALKARSRSRRNNADPLHERRLDLVRLVLAGPDPTSIADDPEGQHVLEELSAAYRALPEYAQRDIALVALPMASREQNALMVNALQRASTIIVQNSLREGFGLTVTEAMWKRIPVLSNRRACGPRQQIRDQIDGRMIPDPDDITTLALTLNEMLAQPACLEAWGRSAQRRAHDHFLIFSQARSWLERLARHV
jgi:trehalose synthase